MTIIKIVIRAINNSFQVNLTKLFVNFGTNLVKFAQILKKASSYIFDWVLNMPLDTRNMVLAKL